MRSSTTIRSSPFLLLLASGAVHYVAAQTYQRLGACPTLGCIFPPDQTDFLAGQLFDVRLEVHAPVNGTEAYNNGVPDKAFSLCIQQVGNGHNRRDGEDGEDDGEFSVAGGNHGHDGHGSSNQCVPVNKFFKVQEPAVETWSFR